MSRARRLRGGRRQRSHRAVLRWTADVNCSLRSPLIDGTEGVYGIPLLLASSGVTCEEVAPWEENGQKWRVLRTTFNETIDTHCAVQKFYFDDKGMLQRFYRRGQGKCRPLLHGLPNFRWLRLPDEAAGG